jgi:hypothetical protein
VTGGVSEGAAAGTELDPAGATDEPDPDAVDGPDSFLAHPIIVNTIEHVNTLRIED